MNHVLDKIFNPYSLFGANIAIIILTLTVGGGMFFYQSGLIHIIAVLFIILAASRIFGHYYTYDPILEKFFHACLIALTIFAASHIIEFFSIVVLKEYKDATFAEVANLYLISLFSIIFGAGFFLKIRHSWETVLQKISAAAMLILFALSIAFLFNDKLISLDAASPAPYLYSMFVFFTGLVALVEISKIKRLTAVAHGFVNYLSAGIVLIVLAAIPNIFYNLLEGKLGASDRIIVYFSHYAFYAALSLLFLSFRKLSFLGGVYEDLKKLEKQKTAAG